MHHLRWPCPCALLFAIRRLLDVSAQQREESNLPPSSIASLRLPQMTYRTSEEDLWSVAEIVAGTCSEGLPCVPTHYAEKPDFTSVCECRVMEGKAPKRITNQLLYQLSYAGLHLRPQTLARLPAGVKCGSDANLMPKPLQKIPMGEPFQSMN
jgi:hypothetical protein